MNYTSNLCEVACKKRLISLQQPLQWSLQQGQTCILTFIGHNLWRTESLYTPATNACIHCETLKTLAVKPLHSLTFSVLYDVRCRKHGRQEDSLFPLTSHVPRHSMLYISQGPAIQAISVHAQVLCTSLAAMYMFHCNMKLLCCGYLLCRQKRTPV